MRKDKQGNIVFVCNCGNTLHTNTNNFYLAKEKLDKAGWKSYRKFNHWINVCNICITISNNTKGYDDAEF